MARPLRIEYPGAWYHVMNRGRRKEQIFFNEKDYILFIKILGDCVRLYGFEIHAYSLMPNHYHLLIHILQANLSRIMRHLNGVYTQKINFRYKFDGSLFRGRFKSMLIEKESYFLELLRYIHRNPLEAKLVDKVGSHKWTSHGGYMEKKERPQWLTTNTALMQFSQYEKIAQRELDAFVKKEVPKDLEGMLSRVKWPATLGGDEFNEMVKEKIRGKKIEEKEVPQYKDVGLTLSANEVFEILVNKQKLWEEDIFRNIKKRVYTEKKRAFVYVSREHLHLPCRDICNILGGVSFAAVSRLYEQAVREIDKKEGCYEEVRKLRDVLKLNIKT